MKAWAALLVLWLSIGSAQAYRPNGWAWYQWPYAYDLESGGWTWFSTANTQWVVGPLPAVNWQKMASSGLASGWTYTAWPYAYDWEQGVWFYLNEADTQWCLNQTTGQWSRFGRALAPPGMVLVPGGVKSGTDPDFGAYTLVVNAFSMDRHEVTRALWTEVVFWSFLRFYVFESEGFGKGLDHPVQGISWYDVVKWCNARSERDGRTPVYYTDAALTQVYRSGQMLEPFVNASANGYRLPTDQEWEYAARGTVANRRFPSGDVLNHGSANYYSYWNGDAPFDVYDQAAVAGYHPDYNDGGLPYTSPVGSLVANGYGLYDLAGNVWEWCHAWYPGYAGTHRVIRGGAWSSLAQYCRVGLRVPMTPDSTENAIGFRTVAPPLPPP